MAMDQIILFAALGIVAGILGWGVLTMARGGEYNICLLYTSPSPRD